MHVGYKTTVVLYPTDGGNYANECCVISNYKPFSYWSMVKLFQIVFKKWERMKSSSSVIQSELFHSLSNIFHQPSLESPKSSMDTGVLLSIHGNRTD